MNQAHICTPRSHPGMSISHMMSSSIIPSWWSQPADRTGKPGTWSLMRKWLGNPTDIIFFFYLFTFHSRPPLWLILVTDTCSWLHSLRPVRATPPAPSVGYRHGDPLSLFFVTDSNGLFLTQFNLVYLYRSNGLCPLVALQSCYHKSSAFPSLDTISTHITLTTLFFYFGSLS